jgi:hypothetical protein
MKKPLLFTAISLIISLAAFSQDVIKNQPCNNASIQHQADSLKSLYAKDGFVLLKEASITMESEYEMPVVMSLTEGTWYQFVFIGDYTSKLYEVRQYDWDEKMVVYKKLQWGDVDGNIISYSYIPKFSEPNMFKPVQVNKTKKKDLCGYVMMFKKLAPPNSNAKQ